METFRHYLLGSEFSVRTDHSSLVWLKEAKNGRLCRWALRLAEYGDFPIIHRSGRVHSNVDAFTRVFADSEEFPDKAFCSAILPSGPTHQLPSKEELIKAQQVCPRCIAVQKRASNCEVQGGVLGFPGTRFRPLLPDSLLEQVVRALHEPPHHAHLGPRRTYAKVAELFSVSAGLRRVAEILSKCLPCRQRKPPLPAHGKLASSPPSRPWDTVAIDFCGPYITSDSGKRFILVMVDHFTKYVELVPTADQTAKTVCEAFYREIICRHGCPARLLSDQGPQFRSELLDQLCGIMGIRKIFSSAYYPQGDGMAERFMRTLNNSLSVLSRSRVRDWDSFVCGVQFAYNSSVHASTGATPFSLTTGRVPSFPEEGWMRRAAPHETQSQSEFVRDLYSTIAKAHEDARIALHRSWSDLKRRYDAKRREITLPIGSTVLIRLSDYERSKFPCRKLAPRWSDPAEVIGILSNGKTYKLRRTNGEVETVNVSRLLPLGPEMWDSPEPDEDKATVSPIGKERHYSSDSEEETVQAVPPSHEPAPASRMISAEPSSVMSDKSGVGGQSSADSQTELVSLEPIELLSSPSSSEDPSSRSTATVEHASDTTFHPSVSDGSRDGISPTGGSVVETGSDL